LKPSRKTLYQLSLLTLLAFPLLAVIVIYFFKGSPLTEVMATGVALPEQLLRGLIYGVVAAANALWLVKLDILKPATGVFKDILGDIKFRWYDIVFFSLCAGIGEELFFRGALQQYWGIWPTAFLFILIHGYLSLTEWRITLYGILAVIISAGLGYLASMYGIWAAAMAHFVYDVVIFAYIIWFDETSNQNEVQR